MAFAYSYSMILIEIQVTNHASQYPELKCKDKIKFCLFQTLQAEFCNVGVITGHS